MEEMGEREEMPNIRGGRASVSKLDEQEAETEL